MIGLGLLIGAAEFSQKGVDLFGGKKGDQDEDDFDEWPSISPSPAFEQYMAFSQFKDFRRFSPLSMLIKAEKKPMFGGNFLVPSRSLIKLELLN